MKEAIVGSSWNSFLELIPENDRDIYFTEQYVKLYETKKDSAECFIYREDERLFLFPYLKRKIQLSVEQLFDFESQYGYGGPLINDSDASFIARAFNSFCSACRETGIIAGFIRFHPLLDNHRYCRDHCTVVFDCRTIAMDLRLSEEDIWIKEIHSKHRNVIRKAQQYGLRFEADEALRYMEDFKAIYDQTMENLGADDFYRFPPTYYKKIVQNCGDNAFIGTVWLQDRLIAAAIFFSYGKYGHYHLAGSLKEYLRYYPNNFLIYCAALYLRRKGADKLHLGGGLSGSEEDSLYRFKSRFSREHYNFYIGKIVLDQAKYAPICKAWEDKNPGKIEKYGKRLLKYRY